MKINYFYKGLKESIPNKYILDTYLNIMTQRPDNIFVKKMKKIYEDELGTLFAKCVWYVSKKSNVSHDNAIKILLEFFKKRKTKNFNILRDTILYCYLLEIRNDSDNSK